MADRLIIRDENARARALQRILALDLSQPQEISIKPHKRSRSLEQNALYWLQLNALAKEIGHTADELHEVVKMKFLPPTFVDLDGEVHEVRRSTTKLNVKEMAEYMERFQAWAAADLGIALPFPEDMLVA